MFRSVARRASVLALGLFVAACETHPAHEVLALTDLSPRQLEVGDRVIVRGSGFPNPADIRRVTVTLTGTLARPGQAPCARPVSVTLQDPPESPTEEHFLSGVVGETPHATTAYHTLRVHGGTVIEFTLTEALVRALSTCPGERTEARVPHVTVAFVGARAGISVRIETMQGTILAAPRPLRGLHLDVLTPWGRDVSESRAARIEAERSLARLGIQLTELQPPEGGLQIAHVAPQSPAEEAGLANGDLIERLDGVTLLSPTDFRPALGNELSVVSVRRGDAIEDRVLRVATLTRTASQDIVAMGVLLLVAIVVVGMSTSTTLGLPGWLATRFLPPRQLSVPVSTWREALERTRINLLASLGTKTPFWSVAVATTALAIPLAEFLFRADIDLALVHVLGGLASLLLAASTVRDPTGRSSLSARLLGIARRALFEIAALGSVAAVVLLSGATDLQGIMTAQGGALWNWYLFRGPVLFALGAVHLAVLALIAADGHTASTRFLRGWATSTLFVRAACAVSLFGGALRLPGISLETQGDSVSLQMLSAVVFSLKTWSLVALALHVAPSVARTHPALLGTLALRHFLPLSIIGFVLVVTAHQVSREIPMALWELASTLASHATLGVALIAVALVLRPIARGTLAHRTSIQL